MRLGRSGRPGFRPSYESVRDVEEERLAGRMLHVVTGWHAVKWPQYAAIDFCLIGDGVVRALAEFKARRKYSSSDMNSFTPAGLMVSKSKIDRGLEISRWQKVPLYLLVNLADGSFFSEIEGAPALSGWGGRDDRDDPLDNEDCYFIPMSDFRMIGGQHEPAP